MVLASLNARAITLSYTVDLGSGFSNIRTQTSGLATLDSFPVAQVIEVDPGSPAAADIAQYILTTTNTATTGGDTIAVNDTYTIRFILGDFNVLGLDPATGFAGASEVLDFKQNVQFTLSGIRIGHDSVSGFSQSFIGPTTGSLGGNPIAISFLSVDFPGSPGLIAPGVGQSAGAFTDQVTSAVPEPSSVAMIAAAFVPLTMFRMRRSRKA